MASQCIISDAEVLYNRASSYSLCVFLRSARANVQCRNCGLYNYILNVRIEIEMKLHRSQSL